MLRQWRRSEFKMRDRTVGVIDAGNVGGMEGSAPPKLSVCIDARENLEHLEGCIRSVLGQTFTDIEIVVGVCCESESTFESALRQGGGDPRFRFQRHASHRSAVQRWNDCLAIVRGDYVKLLPAHTYLTTPDTLARFVAALDRNPAISVVAAAAQFEGRTAFDLAQEVSAISVVAAAAQFEGAETHPAEADYFQCNQSLSGASTINRCLLEQRNLIGGLEVVMFRQERASRGFDERFTQRADLEMWFHLLEQGSFAYLYAPLITSRRFQDPQVDLDHRLLARDQDWQALLSAYLDKPYIRLKSTLRKRLVLDALRKRLQSIRKLGLHSVAEALLREQDLDRRWAEPLSNRIWRHFPQLFHSWDDRSLPPLPICNSDKPGAPRPVGFNVNGFLKGEYGIGESSRAFCRAVEATGLPYAFINIHAKDHRNSDDSLAATSQGNPYLINLMTFSFDYSKRYFLDRGSRFFEGRYNIALWYWEQERFPVRWHCNYDYYDEIWAPTGFCRDALAAASPIPVKQITYPLERAQSGDGDRKALGISPSTTLFLFTFDYFSTIARKNPIGVIEAFQRAFPASKDVALILKSINGAACGEDRALVRQAITDSRVRCIESHLSGQEMNDLFAACDCYVSLHRSEGLGLGMAQAMARAKPVIATAYSGNLEYMDADNSLLVDFSIVELERDFCAYEKGTYWAEPDIDRAAERMRWVHTHREESARIGQVAQQSVRRTLDPEITKRDILARVREIEASAARNRGKP